MYIYTHTYMCVCVCVACISQNIKPKIETFFVRNIKSKLKKQKQIHYMI